MLQTKIQMETKSISYEGYDIHYYTNHDGNNVKTPIVFLHPAFGDHQCFYKQIPHFGKTHSVITLDFLGHGKSQKTGSAKDKIDASAKHVFDILKKENIHKIHLVGVSMGSLIAQYFALQYPEQVESLTVLGGYDINADNSKVNKAQQMEQLKWIWKMIFSMTSFRKYISKMSLHQPAEQEFFFNISKSYKRGSIFLMSGMQNILKVRKDIKRNYPLMILAGEHDLEIAKEAAQEWAAREEGVVFKIMEGAGHCANMDDAPAFNKLLEDFIC